MSERFTLDDFVEQQPITHSVETSVAAAESISEEYPVRLLKMSRAFFDRGHLGYTDEELATALQLGPNSHRAERLNLERLGHIKRTRMRRPTRSGRKAIVYVSDYWYVEAMAPTKKSFRRTGLAATKREVERLRELILDFHDGGSYEPLFREAERLLREQAGTEPR